MELRNISRLSGAVFAAVLLLARCGQGQSQSQSIVINVNGGDSTNPSDDAAVDSKGAADTGSGKSWTQGYGAHLAFHGGPADGVVLDVSAEDLPVTAFAFGSTHKQPPAISLSVQDHQSLVLKPGAAPTPFDFQLNFGNLVSSSTDPLHVGAAGDYAFSCKPAAIRVFFKDTIFKSACDGLTGTVTVVDWSHVKGGRFTGKFKGRLQSWYISNPQDDCLDKTEACTKPDRYVDVEGTFGFTLPAPDGKS